MFKFLWLIVLMSWSKAWVPETRPGGLPTRLWEPSANESRNKSAHPDCYLSDLRLPGVVSDFPWSLGYHRLCESPARHHHWVLEIDFKVGIGICEGPPVNTGGAPSPTSTEAVYFYLVHKGFVSVLDFIKEEFELLKVEGNSSRVSLVPGFFCVPRKSGREFIFLLYLEFCHLGNKALLFRLWVLQDFLLISAILAFISFVQRCHARTLG